MLYILIYWNGETHEESEETLIGVFSTFDKARAAAYARVTDCDNEEVPDPEWEAENATYYIHRQPIDMSGLRKSVWQMNAHEIRHQS